MMKRVLLTGATGFIGRHCLPLLVARRYEVHAVSSRPAPTDRLNIHWHQGDLLDPTQVVALVADVQPSHLLHLAWYAVPGQYWTSTENFRWVQASLGLLQEFARQGGRRVVVSGTCAEYDWRYGYCSEQITPLRPSTIYGACKHSLQVMLAAFSRQMELSASWGRVFFLFGPYEHPSRLVASVIRSVLRGEPVRCSHGNQIRDFLYVEDVADALVTLLNSDISGPVNIASGKPIALRDVVYKIAEMQDRPGLVQLGALPTREDEPPLLVANVERLMNEVGWSPKCDLDQGLVQTIGWWDRQLVESNA